MVKFHLVHMGATTVAKGRILYYLSNATSQIALKLMLKRIINMYCITVSMDQEFRSGLGGAGAGFNVRCGWMLSRASVTRGLVCGWRGGFQGSSLPWRGQDGAVSEQEVSVLLCVGLLSVLTTWYLLFPRARGPGEQGEASVGFRTSLSSYTPSALSSSDSARELTNKGAIAGDEDH